MFNKLKHLKDLRNTAKQMQNALSGESITIEKNGVTVTMNGNMEVTQIIINENLRKESLEDIIKTCTNDAIKKTQRVMAQKMQEMGGFPGLG
ncbi:hypothetical protein A2331_05205 [Candidatus Falkowbacteria bacterium RIFOXYB2_FULL_34_18]|uniref:Nucleoid-associated protein A2531_00675 n=1 Tax=Candidatus Falkowbacteria bacterium RIFOXYD2_FULL_34_120 TaxID=1798007 RepID=A0A1F5TN86_9BACT|nr:MAG: hypothetical protein A2500_07040 [Candidatus Falkowbacteria bacterium RIFOXYC12_FULL_34_55]OGF28740.1 MAG: hypothetical protein A2331_05205 [Candidatus Falkowbacteria bacterium RIFOXYB2_FULL_34_18]OGF38105.1 MAG: hypothetical protein A2466_04385 [Candidatus Falkowbacteria bacterium RIFOXYC2_FULL_34_220]OGF38359.1 MAG: hypothetical protein A2515_06415 [Candidatus Falkowbacteria bacterium RIFOXYD12_FULL_34_57]OGF40346.1 MAG: hypothetical protein A2531_00675 [Candidatus Falkowbacteria bact